MDAEDGKRGRGRGRARGRGRGGRGRGRGKRAARVISSDEEGTPETGNDTSMEQERANSPATQKNIAAPVPMEIVPDNKENEESHVPTIDMEADISQLEAPTFTTIQRGPPEPMVRLDWSHKVNLIGEKVLNPMIHCCDTCLKPILIYGRMIPCKHVFCLKCARIETTLKSCPRCKEKAVRVEQTGLGTVFMCTHGGTRYGNTGCRRTYLSQRDLQAHINHRHVSTPASTATAEKGISDTKVIVPQNTISVPTSAQRKMLPNDIPQSTRVSTRNNPTPFSAPVSTASAFPTASANRTNLITVPIQDSQQQQQQQQQSLLTNVLMHTQLQQQQQQQHQAPPLPTIQQQAQQMGDIQAMTYYNSVGYLQNTYVAQAQQQQSILNSNYGLTNPMSVPPPPPPAPQQTTYFSGYAQPNFNHYQVNAQQQQQRQQSQQYDQHSHQQGQQSQQQQQQPQQQHNNYNNNVQQWQQQQQQYYR